MRWTILLLLLRWLERHVSLACVWDSLQEDFSSEDFTLATKRHKSKSFLCFFVANYV
jgi:hypothetical protein